MLSLDFDLRTGEFRISAKRLINISRTGNRLIPNPLISVSVNEKTRIKTHLLGFLTPRCETENLGSIPVEEKETPIIGQFRVHVCLLFKASLSAKFL